MCTDCSCSTVNIETAPPTTEDTTATTYTVVGMTCGGCASSVSNSVGKLHGVTAVDVDVATGTVAVRAATPLDDDKVRAAVEEAGYQVVTA